MNDGAYFGVLGGEQPITSQLRRPQTVAILT
jgi:hypothetical protein